MSKQKYIVHTPIKGVDVKPGKPIMLDPEDRDTQAMLACKAISLPAEQEAAASGDGKVVPIGNGQQKDPGTSDDQIIRPEDQETVDADIHRVILEMTEEDPDGKNESFWLKSGAPEVKEIERRLGYAITAAERNDVWAEIKQQAEE